MTQFDVRAAVKVGDGARHLQDTVVGASGEAETVHGVLQNLLSSRIYGTVLAHHATGHLRVAEYVGMFQESGFLYLAGRLHPPAYVRAPLRGLVGGQLLVADRNDLHVKISTSWDYRGRFI